MRENIIRFEQEPPQHGAIPLVPTYEVQSLSMELGEEPILQVEGVNTASNDAIFSYDNKVTQTARKQFTKGPFLLLSFQVRTQERKL